MQKPLTVRHKEFIDAVEKLINESGLSAFAMRPVLQDAMTAVAAMERKQYEHDLESWEWEEKNKGEKENA